MKQIKKTDDYRIFQKKSGRYAVRGANKQWLHGEEKTAILQDAGLVQKLNPKAPAAEPAAEEAAA